MGTPVGAAGVCGVVDEHVKPAELFNGAVNHHLHIVCAGHVHCQRQGASSLLANLVGGTFDITPANCLLVRRVAVRASAGACYDYISPHTGKLYSGCPTDSPGDDPRL